MLWEHGQRVDERTSAVRVGFSVQSVPKALMWQSWVVGEAGAKWEDRPCEGQLATVMAQAFTRKRESGELLEHRPNLFPILRLPGISVENSSEAGVRQRQDAHGCDSNNTGRPRGWFQQHWTPTGVIPTTLPGSGWHESWGGKKGTPSLGLFVVLETWFLSVAVAVVLCRTGWSGAHRDLPVSASWVVGLKVCTTTVNLGAHFW